MSEEVPAGSRLAASLKSTTCPAGWGLEGGAGKKACRLPGDARGGRCRKKQDHDAQRGRTCQEGVAPRDGRGSASVPSQAEALARAAFWQG